MKYNYVSLLDMINQNEDKKTIIDILNSFSSPLNPDIENFIHTKAYDFERIGLTRTYLIYAVLDNNEMRLVAVYCLGQSDVEMLDNLSGKDRKYMFGTSYPLGKNVKTLLIGQLSKNYTCGNNNYITGDILMLIIFLRIQEIHKLFPSVVTHIDCKDDIHLRNYYEKYGFRLFKNNNGMLLYLKPTNEIYYSSNNNLSYELQYQ